MKIIVTGASGFIGSAFVRLAISRGHHIESWKRPYDLHPLHIEALKIFQADALVHCGWITTPGVYLESPENRVCFEESYGLIHTLYRYGLVKHVVALGSCIDDGTTIYGQSKGELLRLLSSEMLPWDLCWARIFYPYGLGGHPGRSLRQALQVLRDDHSFFLKSRDLLKDFIYIDDVASALLTCVEQKVSGIVPIGTGTGTTVHDFFHTLGRLLGKEHLIIDRPSDTPDPAGNQVADISRLRQLGWSPTHSLEQGLQKSVDPILSS